MFIDLNVPVPHVSGKQGLAQTKKGKGKQPQQQQSTLVSFTPAQISTIESRLDLLVQLGYTIFALNQTVQRKVDPKSHVNVLDPLLSQLRARPGVVLLKRLTIVLDEESEKGFGLTTQNAALLGAYDLLALAPTTAASFSLACLTHTLPSPLTAHILALPLTLPRLPFQLRHTLVRTARKNGAVFEINYAGALGAEGDPGGGDAGAGAKRNWWAAAREVVRVTKGKGVLVSGGVLNEADVRAPRDVGNLITILGLPQDVAHDAATRVPQSLILRAQTRRTYRAVLSEPKVVIPASYQAHQDAPPVPAAENSDVPGSHVAAPTGDAPQATADASEATASTQIGKKRALDEHDGDILAKDKPPAADSEKDGSRKKKKQKKAKETRA